MDMTTSIVDHTFRKDVRRCFEQHAYAIPARWLYDRRGSELFEDITELPEYYPTRTETRLLKDHGSDFAKATGTGRASRSIFRESFWNIALPCCRTIFPISRSTRSKPIS